MALYVMFFLFTSCVNRRLLLRSIVEDTFLVNKNEDFFCERKPSIAAKKAKNKKDKKAKKKKAKVEEDSSADGEKSDYEES